MNERPINRLELKKTKRQDKTRKKIGQKKMLKNEKYWRKFIYYSWRKWIK